MAYPQGNGSQLSLRHPSRSHPPEARDLPPAGAGVVGYVRRRLGERPVYEVGGVEHVRSFGGFVSSVHQARTGMVKVWNPAGTDYVWVNGGGGIMDHGAKVLGEVYGCGYQSYPGRVAKTAMGEVSGTLGGYTVPPDLTLQMMETFEEEEFIYPRCRAGGSVLPMDTQTIDVPVFDAVTVPTAAAISPFFGGVTYAWGDSQAPAETEPKFRQVTMTAWSLTGFAAVSNQWLGDAGPDAEEHLVKCFGRAAAWAAGYAYLRGTGTAQQMPLGILNAPCLVTVARKSATQINPQDIGNMLDVLLPSAERTAIWTCGPGTFTSISQMTNFFLNVSETPNDDGYVGILLGRPVFRTEKMPALGTQGDLCLFDPRCYLIGDRQQVVVDVSPHSRFANYQTDFRVWLRQDGRPLFSGAITLQDKATVVSMAVALK